MPFTTIPAYTPGKNKFNLSYVNLTNCDMGQLIPVMCKKMIPGDKFRISNEVVVRFQPLVAPILQDVTCYLHTFFVPERILFNSWDDKRKCNTFDDKALELFLTGGVDGTDDSVKLPLWTGNHTAKYTIWDYLGLPLLDYSVNSDSCPVAFPRNAYNKIWNDYYRDETLQDEVPFDNEQILYRNLRKDYFTSALPWQQRGTAPALPISGFLPLQPSSPRGETHINGQFISLSSNNAPTEVTGTESVVLGTNHPFLLTTGEGGNFYQVNGFSLTNVSFGKRIGVDLRDAATFDVTDLRLAFQIQKWLERNARGGVRLNEFLLSHFGTAPNDDTLQRAVYVGGSKAPIIVSEVVQTVQDGTGDNTRPLGNLGGKALTADVGYQGEYYAKEFGWIMTIMSVIPKLGYLSQGIPRELLVRTRYDYPFPEFVNLSEQAVYNCELYADALSINSKDMEIFGYQGRFDEFRHSRSLVSADMRDKLSYWHLYQGFANTPTLNGDFISWKGKDLKRVFAVQNEPGLVCLVGNNIDSLRPLPSEAVPGLIDHH